MKTWIRELTAEMPRAWIIVVVAMIAGVAGWMLRGPGVVGGETVAEKRPDIAQDDASGTNSDHQKQKSVQTFSCSMHPQIRRAGPGLCPICKMELVPVADSGEGARTLAVTEEAAALMDIRTMPVERRQLQPEVRMFGRVTYDETRLAKITAWVGGRIDRLFVDFTGMRVEQGDHMAELYSPELYAAQEELLQATAGARELAGSDVDLLRRRAEATVAAAREKLRLLGLSEEQIGAVVTRGAPSEHVTIHSPISGVVIDRQATEGAYVKTGAALYTVADLTHLWVELDAYEPDLPWVDYGRKVAISAAAFPGESFEGWISFISPVVDDRTRTVKVRVNVENPAGRLKPEMFVHAVTLPGRLDLASKWICPMHPEVVKPAEGTCTICGMALVRSEKAGFAARPPADPQIAVPASAVLWTGERSVVYVRLPDADKPTFVGREVTIGPRAGDWYIVRSGLADGELVVTHGNFKIDSALQISAKPSMMTAATGDMPETHSEAAGDGEVTAASSGSKAPEAFQKQLGAVWKAYVPLQKALTADDTETARRSVEAITQALDNVEMGILTDHAHMAWMTELGRMREALKAVASAEDLKAQRVAFEGFADALTAAIKRHGVAGSGPIYRVVCPMAFGDRAAFWLQDTKAVRNPYWGPSMLECGEVKEALAEPEPEGADD